MELGTGLAILGSAKVIEKVLGPTAEYVGEGLQRWTENRVRNVKKIFSIAVERLGDDINRSGEIPPRVLKGVLDEGSYVVNEIGAQYFGGILAASRTTDKYDDRGVAFIELLTRMSSYQIRLHYILYRALKEMYDKYQYSVTNEKDRHELQMLIPLNSLKKSLGVHRNEFSKILTHSSFGLYRESLVESFFWGAPQDFYQKFDHIKDLRVGVESFRFTPSSFGVELFLWVHGMKDVDMNNFFSTKIDVDDSLDIDLPTDSIPFPSK